MLPLVGFLAVLIGAAAAIHLFLPRSPVEVMQGMVRTLADRWSRNDAGVGLWENPLDAIVVPRVTDLVPSHSGQSADGGVPARRRLWHSFLITAIARSGRRTTLAWRFNFVERSRGWRLADARPASGDASRWDAALDIADPRIAIYQSLVDADERADLEARGRRDFDWSVPVDLNRADETIRRYERLRAEYRERQRRLYGLTDRELSAIEIEGDQHRWLDLPLATWAHLQPILADAIGAPLGVTNQELSAALGIGLHFQPGPSLRGEPVYLGISGDHRTVLQFAGRGDDLSIVSLTFFLPFPARPVVAPAALLTELVRRVMGDAESSMQWLQTSIRSLVAVLEQYGLGATEVFERDDRQMILRTLGNPRTVTIVIRARPAAATRRSPPEHPRRVGREDDGGESPRSDLDE